MLKAIRGIYNSSNQMYFQGKKAELKKKEKDCVSSLFCLHYSITEPSGKTNRISI